MTAIQRYRIPVLLTVSSLLLFSLVPGGPVEHRDFSRLDAGVLLAFNLFLTLLGIGSLLLAFGVLRRSRLAHGAAMLAGIAYFTVYALDLIGLFPQSPTAMTTALYLIEIAGLAVAIPLVVHACRALRLAAVEPPGRIAGALGLPTLVSIGLAAFAIVWFATDSALHSGIR